MRIGIGLNLYSRTAGLGGGGGVAPGPTQRFNFMTGTMPAGITFTRSSSAWYFGSNGLLQTALTDVGRFDYSPSTLSLLGLLVEEQRINVALWNRDLTNAAWVAVNVTPALNQTGIDGVTNSASSITGTVANGTIIQTVVSGTNTARDFSFYVKRLSGTGTLSYTINGGTAWVDVTSQVPASGSGWVRLSGNFTYTNPTFGFRIGTIGDSFAIDFVQNEVGAFTTSPILTTTVAVTRGSDVPLVTPISWYNLLEGTCVARWINGNVLIGGYPAFFSLSTSVTESINIFSSSASTSGMSRVGNSNVGITVINGIPGPNTVQKHAFGYKLDDFASSRNGSAIVTDAAGAVPASLDRLYLGRRVNVDAINGWLQDFSYWNTKVANINLPGYST